MPKLNFILFYAWFVSCVAGGQDLQAAVSSRSIHMRSSFWRMQHSSPTSPTSFGVEAKSRISGLEAPADLLPIWKSPSPRLRSPVLKRFSLLFPLVFTAALANLYHLLYVSFSHEISPIRTSAPGKPIRVLHAALEFHQASVGGIGSVTKTLLPALHEHEANLVEGGEGRAIEASLILPAFSFLRFEGNTVSKVMTVRHLFRKKWVESSILKVSSQEETLGVPLFLISPGLGFEDIFDISGPTKLYSESTHYQPIERWFYFDTALASFISQYRHEGDVAAFDILHLHSYHTAATVLYLDYYTSLRGGRQQPFARPKTIFHMHSLSFDQGWVKKNLLEETGLGSDDEWENLTPQIMDHVDHILTVSQGVLQQGLSDEYAEHFGLSSSFREAQRQKKLHAIFNGINTNHWDPSKEGLLLGKNQEDFRFSEENIGRGKQSIKLYLHKLGYLSSPNSVLFTFVGRFSDEKGIDLLSGATKKIISQGGAVAILGEYTKSLQATEFIHDLKEKAEGEFLGKLILLDSWESQKKDRLGLLVRAATDFSLVPSYEESCGLVPIELFCFGAFSIASKIGGLQDSIISTDLDEDDPKKFFNGFNFAVRDSEDFYWAIDQAFRLAKEFPTEFSVHRAELMRRAKNFDWLAKNGSIDKLIFLYRNIALEADRESF